MIHGYSSQIEAQEYFQQEVNYTIRVTLNDKKHELSSFETITYINNSPDTLHFLYFNLWPNGYRDNNTALAHQLMNSTGKEKLFKDPELKGFIDSLNFKIDGQNIAWHLLPDQPDVCQLLLNAPLNTNDSITITTPFHVKIPKGVTSRLGHIEQSYQISQWYPKAAVYDRNGWHPMSYLDQGEFYSDFGNYDIRITLPENYIVGATGNLQNEKEQQMLDTLAAQTARSVPILSNSTDIPTSALHIKTIRYTQDNIHDFAWFADKRFHVLKGTVILPQSGRQVTTWVMFTNQQANLWEKAIPYVNQAIWQFSTWNGDYPYQSFTAVQSALTAGVGMEYPGITVIGLVTNGYGLDEVIAHEIGHNWFYSALGSNERIYPFLDEGITSAYQMRYMNARYPEKKLWEFYFKKKKIADFLQIDKMPVKLKPELDWLIPARINLEQPINLPATSYSSSAYGSTIYSKAALGFNYLRAYLGDSLFDAAMHDYYFQWKFKHPQPKDLQRIFESHTKKDLNWFFIDFSGTTKRLDYKIVRLKNNRLLIRNKGELNSPLVIAGLTKDSTYFKIWKDGFTGQKWFEIPTGNYHVVKIDPNHVMTELYRLNNNIRTDGIFKKADPIKLQLAFTLDDPDKQSLMYLPALDWTRENGLLIGIAIHNGFLLPKKIEYLVMPLISLKNASVAGLGKITMNILPYENAIRLMTISLEASKFGAPGQQEYQKVEVGTVLYLKTSTNNNGLYRNIFGSYIRASNLLQIEKLQKAQMASYVQIGFGFGKKRILHPFSLITSLELTNHYKKGTIEFNYKFNYEGKDNALDMRIFAGTLFNNISTSSIYALSPNGRSGRSLYLYQGTFPDRFSQPPKTFWSRQMTINEGGLVTSVSDKIGYSHWLISATLTSNLPWKNGRIPVKPFLNLVFNDHGQKSIHPSLFGEAGLKFGIWNFFEIYFPILITENMHPYASTFKDRIHVVFTINALSELKLNTKLAY